MIIEGSEVYYKNPRSIKLTFECLYVSEVKVESDPFLIDTEEAKRKVSGKVVKFGTLDNGFSLSLFLDPGEHVWLISNGVKCFIRTQ